MDRIVKRRTNLLYNLRKKGIRCLTKERVIFFPYGDQEPFKKLQAKHIPHNEDVLRL